MSVMILLREEGATCVDPSPLFMLLTRFLSSANRTNDTRRHECDKIKGKRSDQRGPVSLVHVAGALLILCKQDQQNVDNDEYDEIKRTGEIIWFLYRYASLRASACVRA